MKYLFNSIVEFISQESLVETSRTLNEEPSKVSSAMHAIISSLLEAIIEKDEKKKLGLFLKCIGSSHMLLHVSDLFSMELSFHKQRISAKFLTYLFKNNVEEYYSVIASSSGITKESAKEIVPKVTLLVAAFLGEKLISGIRLSDLIEQLKDEKNDFKKHTPPKAFKVIKKSSTPTFFIQKLWATFHARSVKPLFN
ncbi:MAG: DUF937 domain-containing protein [Flavobacteriaceae bacterium]|jgi:hypothetical protein|nr:DUF937 domain-containing protein [Flavobacteriaceae bacterium]